MHLVHLRSYFIATICSVLCGNGSRPVPVMFVCMLASTVALMAIGLNLGTVGFRLLENWQESTLSLLRTSLRHKSLTSAVAVTVKYASWYVYALTSSTAANGPC